MTFLALTSLQTALLALLVTGAVVALYFLKLRHRRVFVSSSMLWRRVLDDRQAHSLWDKMRRYVSILLAVAIALLIALALARPHMESLTGSNRRIVIVLDSSPTMGTLRADGRTRWQHAVDEAVGLLGSGGPTTEFRIMDTSGQTASAFSTDRRALREQIENMSLRATEPRFPNVDALESVVYFISDGVAIPQAPETVRRISVFEAAQNAGITAFEIRAIPSSPLGFQAYLEVQNYGRQQAPIEITISAPGSQRLTRSITLAPDEAAREIFDLSQLEGGAIRATMQTRNDALDLDNVAFAYLPVRRKTRTMLVTRGNSYLETLLRLDPSVELTVVDPEGYRESNDIDAYILDRFAPATPPAQPALIIGVQNTPWLRQSLGTVNEPAVTAWSDEHPVMQHVAVHDVRIDRATRVDAANLTVVAASDNIPLIVASENPKWVMLTFDLQSSDFPLHVGFPIFVENVLTWFSRDPLAVHRSPGVIDVPIANAQIRGLDGQIVPSTTQMNTTLFEATEPGLYMASLGQVRMQIAVNLASRTFSNVNRSAFQSEDVALAGTAFLKRELWYYMLLAAAILIAAEWFTYHKRITL